MNTYWLEEEIANIIEKNRTDTPRSLSSRIVATVKEWLIAEEKQEETDAIVSRALAKERQIKPGKAGVIEAADVSTWEEGDGVIVDGRLMSYVGIGWVDERKATQADADLYPVVVGPVIKTMSRGLR